MESAERSVFLSYRRADLPAALLIFKALTQRGYDVFIDFEGLAAGDFERVILENINARPHFLVLLTPSALDRASEPGDWLRREIEAAMAAGRNIVPLLAPEFEFTSPAVADRLTGLLAKLGTYNGLPLSWHYFDAAIEKLCSQYLNQRVEVTLLPASFVAAEAARTQQRAASAASGLPSKVAVIFVPGSADQKPGAASSALINLLLVTSSAGTAYRSVGSRDLTLSVHPLKPIFEVKRADGYAAPVGERSLFKSFLQSYRSDFQRQCWETPTAGQVLVDMKVAKAAPVETTAVAAAAHVEGAGEPDRGLAFTDYLLGKYQDSGAFREAYQTTCVELERMADGETTKVDVYEMYWADLSRLSGALPRILSEFGTLIFRLSRLGRDTIDEGRGFLRSKSIAPTAWTVLTVLQTAIDWLFVNVLAQLFFQLPLLGGVLLVLGLARPIVPEHRLHLGVAMVLAVLGLLLFLYRSGGSWRSKVLPMAMLALAAISLVVRGAEVAVTGLVLFTLVTTAYDALLRFADERFPFVRTAGLGLWAVLLAAVLSHRFESLGGAGATLDAWRGAALYGSELALVGIKWFSILLAPLLLLWIVSGLIAQRGGYERSASVATGRLSVGISLSSIVMVTMLLWALLVSVLDESLMGMNYLPEIFPPSLPSAGQSSAQAFLQERYVASVETFAPLAILLLALFVLAVITLFPSVLAELAVVRNKNRQQFVEALAATSDAANRLRDRHDVAAQQVGRWLTTGYRLADPLMLAICIAGVWISMAVMYVFAGFELPSALRGEFNNWRSTLGELSRVLLVPLVLCAAALGGALLLLGGVLSRHAPAVRAPLDVALDIDNYFREFPSKQIPRARIFARYVALLEHVAAKGCDRIVIVAHGQGSVISVETLRWLREGRRLGLAETPARAQLLERLRGEVRLLTAGCPLRQLYAARFPTFYRWVLRKGSALCGPRADDIGVRQWLNAFTSGDNVGRWLWTSGGPRSDAVGEPLAETFDPGYLGRSSVYDGFAPNPPDSGELDRLAEAETCLGVGAHTHYFEPDQQEVAWLIDYLIGSRNTENESSRGDAVSRSP